MKHVFSNINNTRAALGSLTYVSAGLLTIAFLASVASDGLGMFDIVMALLFAVLMAGITMSFWTATFGFFDVLLRGDQQQIPLSERERSHGLPPTAILMPVYNESPADVFAGVEAMRRSLLRIGQAEPFDVFILSDTTNPDVWIREEMAWAEATKGDNDVRVFYRHRRENTERKAGNIADFCQRWGHAYKYMIVLDADSVMVGDTLVEMVRRIDADEEIGILQVPPRPVGCDSLFARLQQFSAATYSLPFLRGFRLWAGDDGNYWGHNAIIRTAAFTHHCSLPTLPGKEPLGGEILSHDFVEAAFMRRAGYKVCLADDLGGSYEQCPTGLEEYAQRDRRWCQGNLQHARLLDSDGFAFPSRLHLLMGVLAYVCSPLWMLFMVCGLWAAGTAGSVADNTIPIALFAISMVMLLLPKAYGVALALVDSQRRRGQGGTVRLIVSATLEVIASILLAPIMMLYHSRFVVMILSGRKVGWSTADRGDRSINWIETWKAIWWAPAIGVALTALTLTIAPAMLIWLSPVIAGLLFAVPFTWLTNRPDFGQWTRRVGLFLIEEETSSPAVLVDRDRLRERFASFQPYDTSRDAEPELLTLLHDPRLLSMHTMILENTGTYEELPAEERDAILTRMSRHEPLSTHQRMKLQGDVQLLKKVHFAVRTGRPLV